MFSVYRNNKKDIEKKQAALRQEKARRNAFALICTIDNLGIEKTVKLNGYMIYEDKLEYVSFFKFPLNNLFNSGYIVCYNNLILVLDADLKYYVSFERVRNKTSIVKKGLTYHKPWYFNTNREKEILYTAKKLFKIMKNNAWLIRINCYYRFIR